MSARRVLRALLILGLFSFAAVSLAQQTGSISGKVTSTDGATLPGVTVEASSPVLPQARVTVTSETGEYRFPQLLPGAYTVKYSLAGLQDATRTVQVLLNQNIAVDVQLGMAGVAETITVTAEATLVDRTSAEIQTGLSSDEIRALPITQEYKDLQRLVPGVQITQDTNRGPSGGGSGQDNVYLFDGVNVTMPLFGILVAEPATHDIAQFSVLKGGARAVDFERAGGFSVDSVSKSGTNEFSGQLSYQTRRPSFIADQKNTATATRFEQTRHWTTANIGGPLLPDQLFFYSSYYRPDYRRDNQANNYGELPAYKLERDEYFGKLTYTPTSAWLINGSYRDSTREETGDTFGGSTAGTVGFGFKTDLKIATAEGSWVPNAKSYGTFKFTDFRNPGGGSPATLAAVAASLAPGTRLDLNALDRAGQLTVPTAGNNPAQAAFVQPFIDRYGFLRNGVRTGGGIVGTSRFSVDDDDFFRKSGEVGFNYTLSGTKATHDLHVGYQRSIDEEDRFQQANGWGLLSVPAGTINCPTNACGSPARPAFFQAQVLVRSNVNVPLIHSEFHSQNFEINDTIRMDNWTFNVGILASEDTLYGQGLRETDNVAGYVGEPGNKYKMHRTPFSKMIQPRLSGTWAYNGSDTLYASYARYNPAANSDARAASWDRNLFREINAYFDENGVLIGSQPVASSSGKLFVDDIDPRYTDEYMIGTAQQLTPNFSSRVYGRYRYSSNFWEDTNNDARIRFGANVPGVRQELYIPDLNARRDAIGSGSSYVIAELDGAFTKYYEATFESDWRAGNTLVRGSYTWSHYYGNFDQDNSSFNTANDAAIFIGSSNIADGAGRQLWDFKYGDLRGDRRHVLKFYGTQVLPWNATVGVFGVYQSGQPYQLESHLPYRSLTTNTSDTNRYAEPAGRRRSPAHHQMDLNYTQNLPIPMGGLNLQLVLDVFNVYDKQTGYNFETRVGTLGVCNTNDCITTDIAGAPNINRPFAKSFYDPRIFQLAARLQF